MVVKCWRWTLPLLCIAMLAIAEGGTATAAGQGAGGAGANVSRRLSSPVPDAFGPHTTYKQNSQDKVTSYQTWEPNRHAPSGFTKGPRVDTQYGNGHTHYNNRTNEHVPTPHVHDKNIPGGVRPANKWELPK